MNKTLKVFIVDDHDAIIDGLSLNLDNESGIKVIGSAKSSEEAIARILTTKPDVVVMDHVLKGGPSGLETSKHLLAINPDFIILFFTIEESAHVIKETLALGVKGYVLKGEDREYYTRGIREVAKGMVYKSPEVEKILLENEGIEKPPILTERELEIAILLAKGFTRKDIAAALFISENTVSSHIKNIYSKLDIHNVAELIAWLRDNGHI